MNERFPVPDEIALRILSYLSQKDLARLSQVNRYFRRISTDDNFWTCITMDAMEILFHDESVRMLFRRCSKLKSVVIEDEDCIGITFQIFNILAEAKCSLKNIQMAPTLMVWSQTDMEALGQMKELKCLQLTISNVEQSQVLENIKYLTGLEILVMRLWRFSAVSPENIQSVNEVFGALKNLRYIDFAPIVDATLSCLVSNNNKLQTIHLHRREITDESLEQIVQTCPDLEVLHIRNNSRALEILCNCVNLRILYLFGNNLCEEEVLTKLVETNTRLERFVMDGGESALVTEKGIQNMCAKAKALKAFTFRHFAAQVGDGAGARIRKKFPGVEIKII